MTDQAETPTAAARHPGDDPDERLYDAYLDAALAGRPEDPSVFVARHPEASALLRARLEALHGMLAGDAGAGPVPSASGAPAAEDVPYERLGEFRLLRKLDEGGMGTVYLAEQESLGRVVALKVIRPELHGSPTAAARFEREAQVLARLRHPNVVTAFAVGVDRGVHYLALEFVPGRGLDEVLAEAAAEGRPVAPAQAVTWAAQIARALHAAHEAGIVHRDVKPSNIRITPDGRPLLLDFGIAHDAEAQGLTRTTPVLGSPAYAAPEQVGGKGPVGPATDVHGLGTTLYECLSGTAPHVGKTIEETLQRVLVEDARPVRQLNASVSRDLETVLSHALEKEPERRYPTAAAFADDLEALLAFRPIAARRPGPLRRGLQWMRRHPAVAAGSLVALVAVVVAAGVSVANERAERERRRSAARGAVDDARAALVRYRESRERTAGLEARVAELLEKQETRYLPPEQDRFLADQEEEADRARREREQAFYDLLELLREAERLDPEVDGVRRIRAELYAEKWDEMRAAGATGAERFYRELVARDDPDGRILAAVEGAGRMLLASDPPDAVLHLFRLRVQSDVVPGGERRVVPTPVAPAGSDGSTSLPPGAWCLHVLEDRGGFAEGDLITHVAGTPVRDLPPRTARRALANAGVEVGVVGRDGRSERTAPAGLRVRMTTQPAPLDASARHGAGPHDLKLPAGAYLAVFTAPGRAPTRCWFELKPTEERDRTVVLPPSGSTPPGFVRVPTDTRYTAYDFFLMEREVTAAEYRTYLNAPEVRAAIDAGEGPERVPRARAGQSLWTRDADGAFVIPEEWAEDWPVIGVSQIDALAYVAWRDARGDAPEGFAFDLPSFDEWTAAARRGVAGYYVFGQRFHPKWMSSCFSRPQAHPEPVLSYPRDEATTGARDMSGSAFEWSRDAYDPGRGLVRLLGGAWGRADPELFKIQGGTGLPPTSMSGETGFRLVLRPTDAR